MINLGGGLYIQTTEEMQLEQKEWDESDHSKSMDFSIYPFWLTFDSGGQNPVGFESIKEIHDYINDL